MATDQKQIAQPRKAAATIEQLLGQAKVLQAFTDVATEYMTPERMVRLCTNAISKTPKLRECNPASVLGAMMTAQSLGLEPNTVLSHAYLIPYKRGNTVDCQFQIGYKGYLALMRRNPHVIDVFGECVHENDFFDHEQGTNTMIRFRKALVNRGEPIASFCYMKYRRGEFEAEAVYVMPLEEIEKIRENSDTWKYLGKQAAASNAKPTDKWKFSETPWEKWFDQMAAKSAIKRLAKQQDLAPAAQIAANIEDAAEGGRLELSNMTDPGFARDVIDGIATPVDDEGAEGDAEITEPPAQTDKKGPAKKPPPKKEAAAPATEEAQPPHDQETGEIIDEEPQQQEAVEIPADPEDADELFPDD